MKCFSLKNYFIPVTYPQFLEYTKEFVGFLQEAHHTKCDVEIIGLPVPKLCIAVMEGDAGAENKLRHRLSHRLNVEKVVGDAAWNAAHHVEVLIKSHDDNQVLASMEFKGCLPKTVTYHFLQPGGNDIQAKVLENHPHTIKGHGYVSHTDKTQYSLAFA